MWPRPLVPLVLDPKSGFWTRVHELGQPQAIPSINMTKHANLLLIVILLTVPSIHADLLIGRIVDTNGVGIANGDIDARNRDTGDEAILTGDSSDAKGYFNITLPAATYDLTVQGPVGAGFVEFFFEDVIIAGTYDLGTLILEPGHILSGRVLDQNGFPVPSCDLDIFHAVTEDPVDVSGARTDVFGNFDIFVPPNIIVNFDPRNVFGPTLAPVRHTYSISGATSVGDITLLPGFTVSGMIRRPNGQTVPGAKLDFTDSLGSEALTYGDTADLLGNFSTVVAADTYEVRICPPPTTTLAPSELEELVITGATALGTLTLPAGVLLFGTLTDQSGTRVAGADVDVIDAVTGNSIPLCGDGTSPIGNYDIRVPAGTYHVLFTTPTQFGLRRDVVLTAQTQVNEVVIPCLSASSAIRNGTGVNPVAFASISPPRIARNWVVELNCAGHAPHLGIVLLMDASHPGVPTFAGEFLMTGSNISVGFAPHTGNILTFSVRVPPNVSLCGRTATGQGIILGAPGPQLTNALDVMVGP